MDLYEAYPELQSLRHDELNDKSLRLIGVSGLARDDTHYCFEFSKPTTWGTLNDAKVIGMGTARVKPDAQQPIYQSLLNHIRKIWRCDVQIESTDHLIIINTENEFSTVNGVPASYPFLVILTAPRLGGSIMPDALVQVMFQTTLTRIRSAHTTNLIRVQRDHLKAMLDQDIWELRELKTLPWIDLRIHESVPENAKVRPVLGLRALKPILDAGLYTV